MIKWLVTLTLLTGSASQSDEPGRVGLTWSVLDHSVIHVYKDSPAAKVGIKKGDRILSDIPKGVAGSLIVIKVLRQGTELTFEVERAAVSAISKQLVDDKFPAN